MLSAPEAAGTGECVLVLPQATGAGRCRALHYCMRQVCGVRVGALHTICILYVSCELSAWASRHAVQDRTSDSLKAFSV